VILPVFEMECTAWRALMPPSAFSACLRTLAGDWAQEIKDKKNVRTNAKVNLISLSTVAAETNRQKTGGV